MQPTSQAAQSNEQHQVEYLKAEIVQLQQRLEQSEAQVSELSLALENLQLSALPEDVQTAYDAIREAVTAMLVCSSVLTESEVQRSPMPPDFEGLCAFLPWLGETL